MIPYSEKEQKTLVERVCQDVLVSSTRQSDREKDGMTQKLPLLQILFDLEFEQKFKMLLASIYGRLPAL